eukprot:TRINITY_DN450_c0_g2_i1.p1 TRINITY_DN450_c0_g2~~TRINITY_DN450_c0_g2_i1.p1  ORF type:complete len:1592 (-),score=450.31 TRINITY_DN450_c0_g2_i1:86-4759(-)
MASKRQASECPSCGNFYLEDAKFCRKCGERRPEVASVPQAPPPPSTVAASGFEFERRRDAAPPLSTPRDSPQDAATYAASSFTCSGAAGLDEAVAAAAPAEQEPVTAGTTAFRPRSASPWRFQMNAKALGRLRPEASAGGGGGSGAVTPTLAGRAASGTRTASVVQAAARASYESALLSAVRRQIEAFEEKVGSQIERIHTQTERAREAQICRLEEKVTAAEGQQPKLDRRLAELGGNFKGLSDEMQSQIRRVDLMDDRLWEWRHQMEEELRCKYGEFEQNVQKVASSFRVMQSSIEDGQKRQQQRIQRLEEGVASRTTSQEEIHEGFANVCARLEALEIRFEEESQFLANTSALAAADVPPHPAKLQNDELAVARCLNDGLVSTSLYDLLSKRLEDLSGKVDSSLQDAHDMHAGMALQEEQLRTLRTMFEAREEHIRALAERVDRGDWAANLKQIREALHEDGKQRQLQAETSQVLSKKMEYLEQAHEQLLSSHDQLAARLSQDVPMSELEERVEGMMALMQASEARLDAVEALPLSRGAVTDSGQESAAHVAQLVQQLKEIVPKVIDHDRSIRQLASDVAAAANKEEQKELQDATFEALRAELKELRNLLDEKGLHWQKQLAGTTQVLTDRLQKLSEVAIEAAAQEETPASALDLDRGLSDLRKEMNSALEDLKWGDLQSQVGHQSMELLAAKDSLKKLGEQLDALAGARAGAADSPAGQLQEEAIGRRLDDLRKEVADLVREQRYLAEENYKELAGELAVMQRQGSLREDLEGLRTEAAAQTQKLSASVRILQDELASHKEHTLQHASQASAGEAAQLHGSLATLQDELSVLKASHSSARDELDRLQESAAERLQLHSSWRNLQVEVDSLKAVTATSAASQDTVNDLRRSVEGFLEELRESQNTVKELRADVRAFKGTAAVTSELQSSVQDLGKEVEGFKQQISGRTNGQEAIGDLRRMVESFQDQIAALKAPEQEHRQLLETLRVQLDSQLDGLRASAAENDRLGSSLEHLRIECFERLQNSAAETAKVDSSMESLRDELQKLRTSVAGTDMLSSSLESFRSDLESLKGLAEEQAKLGDVQGTVVSAEDNAKLISSVRSLQDEVDTVKELRAEVQAIKTLSAAIPELHTSAQEVEELRRSVEGLRAQFADAHNGNILVPSGDCPSCGNHYADDAKFCRKCGEKRALTKVPMASHESSDGLRSLEREVHDMKATAAAAVDSQSAVKLLEAELAVLAKQLEDLKQQMSSRAPDDQEAVGELRRVVEGLTQQLSETRAPDHERAQLLSGFESLRGQLDKQQAFVSDLSKEVEGFRQELSGRPGSDEEAVGELRRVVEGLTQQLSETRAPDHERAQLLSGFESLRGQLDKQQAFVSDLSKEVEGFRQELSGRPGSDEEELLAKVCLKCDNVYASDARFCRKCGTKRESGLALLQSQILRCSQRVDSLVLAATRGGSGNLGDRESIREEMEELANALKQDEEAEADAHKMILGRIDEVCRHLSEVSASGTLQGRADLEAAPEFAKKFDSLVQRVEEMQMVEQQMEARLTEFVSKTAPT